MTVQELKSDIENNKVSDDLLILINSDNSYISDTYVQRIAQNKGIPITVVEDIEALQPNKFNIFGEVDETSNLKIVRVEKLSYTESGLQTVKNAVIIADKVDEKTMEMYKDFIVTIPKLEKWQIKQYATISLEGVSEDLIDRFLSVCNYDIYRISSELSKFESFDKSDIPSLFHDCLESGALSDVTEFNAYNLTNSIQKKDMYELRSCLYDINNIDIDPVGFISLLISGFRKMIYVWLQNNPTEENTGLKSNQIWAINKIPKHYTKEQLIEVQKFLTELDYKAKSGQIDSEDIIDYAILKIFSV